MKLTNLFNDYFEQKGLKPRPGQIKAFETLKNNWEKYKYFICSAPTGVGKSHLAVILSLFSKNSYILTSTKLLQKQYLESDDRVSLIMGQSNYTCAKDDRYSCENSPCQYMKSIKKQCREEKNCPYHNDLINAFNSQIFLTNYSFFLCYPYITRRNLVICDEAHNLESQILSTYKIDVNIKMLGKRFKNKLLENINPRTDKKTITAIFDIFHSILEFQKNRFSEIPKNNLFKEKDFLQDLQKIDKDIKLLEDLISKMGVYIYSKEEDEWSTSFKEGVLTIAPLSSKYGFHDRFLPVSDKTIFLSATPGDKKYVSSEFNIPKNQICFFEIESDFDVKKSPVISIPVAKMSYKEIDNSLPVISSACKQIMEHHKSEKGIIHSTSYKITNYLSTQLDENRILYKKSDSMNNEYLMNLHKKIKSPTVLISPSMTTGIDLKDELSRFQIIVKSPFLGLGEERVKKKSERDNYWYNLQMIITIMQMCGRSTRSQNDFSTTYILDKNFGYFYEILFDAVPKWFRERVHFVDM